MTETFPILSNLSSPGLGRYVKLSQFCFERDINRSVQHGLELNRVRAGSLIFQDWKVLEQGFWSREVLGICQTQGKCMADSKENKH